MKFLTGLFIILSSSLAFADKVTIEMEVPENAAGVYFSVKNFKMNACSKLVSVLGADKEGLVSPGTYYIEPVVETSTCAKTGKKTVSFFVGESLDKISSDTIKVVLESKLVKELKVYFRKEK